MWTAFLSGLSLGLSLILAIGAQNAFVLRQGLRRAHVAEVVAVCTVSDWLLIALGVGAFGWVSATLPQVVPALVWIGAGFLIVYGALRFRAAIAGGEQLEASATKAGSRSAAVLTCLALTWLNPHVYLDTVVFVGAVSTEYAPSSWAFGIGAGTASLIFFVALGFGARVLAPVFARPLAWRLLDVVIGLTMWGLAAKLLLT
jgi:L-lysine exporter family protein LysE/ArgO